MNVKSRLEYAVSPQVQTPISVRTRLMHNLSDPLNDSIRPVRWATEDLYESGSLVRDAVHPHEG